MAKGTTRGFVRYKSYSFRDHDPILDAFATLQEDSGMSATDIKSGGGPSVSTVQGYRMRKVRRPVFCTIMAAARACGATGIQFDAGGRPYFTARPVNGNGRK